MSAKFVKVRAPVVETKAVPPGSPKAHRPTVLPLAGGVLTTVSRRSRRLPNKGRRRGRGVRGSVPALPPSLEIVLAVPFRIRVLSQTNVAQTAPNSITRGSLSAMMGGIGFTTTTVKSWAVTYRLTSITVWPAAGGDCGLIDVVSGSAEQALSKDSHRINNLPTGITVPVGGHVWRPLPGSYLSMWQSANSNSSDVILQYYGNTGSIWDFTGVFTLGYGASFGVTTTVASAVAGNVYYLHPDGPTTHDLAPLGYATTH